MKHLYYRTLNIDNKYCKLDDDLNLIRFAYLSCVTLLLELLFLKERGGTNQMSK